MADNVAVWMQTRLAEMAWQKGDLDAARAHIQRGRALDPEDRYLRHLYADFLLAESRPDAAIDVLEDYVDQDGALLRLAIAAIDAGDRRADRWAQQFRDRMAAAQRSAEYAHLRELARFTLVVEGRPGRSPGIGAGELAHPERTRRHAHLPGGGAGRRRARRGG